MRESCGDFCGAVISEGQQNSSRVYCAKVEEVALAHASGSLLHVRPLPNDREKVSISTLEPLFCAALLQISFKEICISSEEIHISLGDSYISLGDLCISFSDSL